MSTIKVQSFEKCHFFKVMAFKTSTSYYLMRKSPCYEIYLYNSILQDTPATE